MGYKRAGVLLRLATGSPGSAGSDAGGEIGRDLIRACTDNTINFEYLNFLVVGPDLSSHVLQCLQGDPKKGVNMEEFVKLVQVGPR
eukprot:1183751-Prorocentrum_minimum.AAC.10